MYNDKIKVIVKNVDDLINKLKKIESIDGIYTGDDSLSKILRYDLAYCCLSFRLVDGWISNNDLTFIYNVCSFDLNFEDVKKIVDSGDLNDYLDGIPQIFSEIVCVEKKLKEKNSQFEENVSEDLFDVFSSVIHLYVEMGGEKKREIEIYGKFFAQIMSFLTSHGIILHMEEDTDDTRDIENNLIDKGYNKYSLLGQDIIFTEQEVEYIRLRVKYRNIAKKNSEIYRRCNLQQYSWNDFCKTGLRSAFEMIRSEVNQVVQYLINSGHYDVTEDYIVENFYEYIYEPWIEVVNSAIDVNKATEQSYEKIAQYREIRKDCRAKMIGGGTSIPGIIKGVAFSAGVNLVTGVAHSFINSIQNSHTKSHISESCNKFFSSEEFKTVVLQNFEQCIENIWIILYTYESSKYCVLNNKDEALERMLKNYDRIPNVEHKSILVKAIQNNPIDVLPYRLYLLEFDSEYDHLLEFAIQLGVESILETAKKDAIRCCVSKLKKTVADKKTAEDALAEWKRMRESVKCTFQQMPCEIEFNKYCKDCIKQEISAEIESKTARGVLYSTVEDAELARENQRKAERMCKNKSNTPYLQVQKNYKLLLELNKNPQDCIKNELAEYEAYYNEIDKAARSFLKHEFASYEEAMKAKKDYEVLKKELETYKNKRGVESFVKSLDKRNDIDEVVKKAILNKAKPMLEQNKIDDQKREIDLYIQQKYPNIEYSEANKDNIQILRNICDDVRKKYGDKASSSILTMIKGSIVRWEHYLRLSSEKKEKEVGIAIKYRGKIVGVILIAIVLCILNLIFIPWKILKIILFMMIIGFVMERVEKIKEKAEESKSRNKSIEEAKKKIGKDS